MAKRHAASRAGMRPMAWRAVVAMICLVLPLPLLGQAEPDAGDGGGAATLFEKLCYSCHNIGGGDKTGPDLMGVTENRERDWLRQFIPSPRSMKRDGDATAVELFAKYAPEQMADQMLSEDQIDQILDMIQELSATGQIFIPESGKLSREPAKDDIPAGRSLFIGQTRPERGGPACINCHSAVGIGHLGGGTLGPDLTNANLKYKDVELASIIKLPGLPVMSKVFADHELSDEEVVQLFAFLQHIRNRDPEQARFAANSWSWSVAGVILLFGTTGLLWRGRLRGVRRQLTRSQR
ncbi:MAG: c-type cytochrome [Armatimonadota bacterium]